MVWYERFSLTDIVLIIYAKELWDTRHTRVTYIPMHTVTSFANYVTTVLLLCVKKLLRQCCIPISYQHYRSGHTAVYNLWKHCPCLSLWKKCVFMQTLRVHITFRTHIHFVFEKYSSVFAQFQDTTILVKRLQRKNILNFLPTVVFCWNCVYQYSIYIHKNIGYKYLSTWSVEQSAGERMAPRGVGLVVFALAISLGIGKLFGF